jgi:hypothetical protein
MTQVHWHDPVYGVEIFTEPLLCDLFHARAVQRLADIHQGGVTAYIKPERATTRLDHSVGVAILLRRLGADVVEQAAGLVHDVPHTAFSHVIDFVFPNHDHVYHEEHREQMIPHSDLPDLLARHGLDWRRVTEAENFSLLEQPLPALCADRLDYFLRDGVVDFDAFTVTEVEALLDHLRIWEGRVVVDDIEAARWLGEMFIKLDDLCWCSVQEVGWYAIMARALRAALRHGIITEADFAGADDPIMARLRAAEAPEVQGWLALLRPEVDFVRTSPPADLHVLPKVRAVDPDVLVEGRAVPLSRLDPAFAQHRNAYLKSKAPPWNLRIVS